MKLQITAVLLVREVDIFGHHSAETEPNVPRGSELFRGFLKVSENFDTLTRASRRRCCWHADATARQSVPNTEREEKEEMFLFLLAEGGS